MRDPSRGPRQAQALADRLFGSPGPPQLAWDHPVAVQQDDALATDAWSIDAWRRGSSRGDRRRRIVEWLPSSLSFTTSGSTGTPQVWTRTIDQLLAEVDLISQASGAAGCDAVIAFAPPFHLYGFLASFLLPLVEGLPVAFHPMARPAPIGRLHVRRPLFVAVPSALALLAHRVRTLRAYERVTVLHSTAALPQAGRRLVESLTPDHVTLVELFGSTETGLLATRTSPSSQRDPWTLAPDVEPAWPSPEPDSGSAEPIALRVRSPRIAAEGSNVPSDEWETDDLIRPLAGRRFVLEGRRSLLVKLNGRRVYLDAVEERIRAVVPCADLVCVPVADEVGGEGFDVVVVPEAEDGLTQHEVRRRCLEALRGVGQPREVRFVRAIPRSAVGKASRASAH